MHAHTGTCTKHTNKNSFSEQDRPSSPGGSDRTSTIKFLTGHPSYGHALARVHNYTQTCSSACRTAYTNPVSVVPADSVGLYRNIWCLSAVSPLLLRLLLLVSLSVFPSMLPSSPIIKTLSVTVGNCVHSRQGRNRDTELCRNAGIL